MGFMSSDAVFNYIYFLFSRSEYSMIHHRDEYNAECEKGTAPFMVRLFICT